MANHCQKRRGLFNRGFRRGVHVNLSGITTALFVILSANASPVLAVNKVFVGPGLFWNTDSNWNPVGVPTSADFVFFNGTSNNTILLSDNAFALGIGLENGNDLVLQGLDLTTTGAVSVDKTGTRLLVGSGSVNSGTYVLVEDFAEIQIAGGVINAGYFALGATASLRGNGTVNLDSSAADGRALLLNGAIVAENGVLHIESTGVGVFNFQSGSPVVSLDVSDNDSTLNLVGDAQGEFPGTVLIGENSTLNVTDNWDIGMGEMHFDGGDGTATLTGGTHLTQGAVFVNSGTAIVDNAVFGITPAATVTVEKNSELSWTGSIGQAGQIQLNGGSLNGTQLNNNGDISGFGAINNPVFENLMNLTVTENVFNINSATTSFTSDSNVVIESGAELVLVNSPSQQLGSIHLNGGILSGALLVNGGDISGFGTISNSVLVNQDGIEASDAKLTINSPTALFTNSSVTTITSELELGGTVTFQSLATVSGIGSLIIGSSGSLLTDGDGMFGVSITNQGALAPGSSPAVITTTGNYTQVSGGIFEVEIGSTGPTEFDRIIVGGVAQLGGVLDVSLIDGFVPQLGQTFDILESTLVNGEFEFEDFPIFNGHTFEATYELDRVILEVVISDTLIKEGFES
jgi:hypothetical protein